MTDPDAHTSADPTAAPAHSLGHDIRTAFGNSIQLGLSLFATWGVAFLVRFLLPRQLGPERFGLYSFADSLAAAVLGVMSLGVDPYIRKEIPVRPEHASDFFGGVVLLRTLMAALAIAGVAAVLHLTGRAEDALIVVTVFALGYTIFNLNNSLAALLQANTTVGGLAIANPVAKLLWGGLVVVSLARGASLPTLAAAFGLSELARALMLSYLVRRQMHLELRLDLAASWTVVVVSLPYYLNSLVLALNVRLDVALLGFLARDNETVGWYGAAANLAGLSLLLVPLMFAVLMPLLSRSFHRSREEFWSVMRRALELLLVVSLPVTLFLALGADLWVRTIFGRAFGPSAPSLSALAPQFVFTYVAMLLSMGLIVLDKGWTLARISLAGLLVHPLLLVVLVKTGQALWGATGAGLGAALGSVGAEILVTALLFAALGRGVFDRRTASTLVRSLLVLVVVVVLFVLLAPLGHLRLPICAAAYGVLALLSGAVRVRVLLALMRQIRHARA